MVNPMTFFDAPAAGLVDLSHWPVVLARMPAYSEERTRDWLAAVDHVLERGEPFVVVGDMEAYMHDAYEASEEKKQAALWFKHNRERFHRLCRGNVYVLENDAARAALLEGGRKQAKASGLPIDATATVEEAIVLARTFLG